MSKSKRKGEKQIKTAKQLSKLGGIAGDGSKKHERKLKKFNKTIKQHTDTLRKPSYEYLSNPDNYLIGEPKYRTPIKQVGVVDPLTSQQVQQMTNVPPQQANTLGQARPVFNPQAQKVAQGIYGGIDQRQNSVGATPLFQKKLLWQPQNEQPVEQEMIKEQVFKPSQPELIKQPQYQAPDFERFEEYLPNRGQKMYIDKRIKPVKPQRL